MKRNSKINPSTTEDFLRLTEDIRNQSKASSERISEGIKNLERIDKETPSVKSTDSKKADSYGTHLCSW